MNTGYVFYLQEDLAGVSFYRKQFIRDTALRDVVNPDKMNSEKTAYGDWIHQGYVFLLSVGRSQGRIHLP